jgi:hypothetical protein
MPRRTHPERLTKRQLKRAGQKKESRHGKAAQRRQN